MMSLQTPHLLLYNCPHPILVVWADDHDMDSVRLRLSPITIPRGFATKCSYRTVIVVQSDLWNCCMKTLFSKFDFDQSILAWGRTLYCMPLLDIDSHYSARLICQCSKFQARSSFFDSSYGRCSEMEATTSGQKKKTAFQTSKNN